MVESVAANQSLHLRLVQIRLHVHRRRLPYFMRSLHTCFPHRGRIGAALRYAYLFIIISALEMHF